MPETPPAAPPSTSPAPALAIEHAKVTARIASLDDRIGELRRHL
jgi:hypothetical protein